MKMPFFSPTLAFPPAYSFFWVFLSFFRPSYGPWNNLLLSAVERGLGNVILHFLSTETSNSSFSLPSGQTIFIFPSSRNDTDAAKTAHNKIQKNTSYIVFWDAGSFMNLLMILIYFTLTSTILKKIVPSWLFHCVIYQSLIYLRWLKTYFLKILPCKAPSRIKISTVIAG